MTLCCALSRKIGGTSSRPQQVSSTSVHARHAMIVFLVVVSAAPLRGDVTNHRWWLTTTRSFELYSDLTPAGARELAVALEHFRRAAIELIPSDGDFDAPQLRIIVFRDPSDFREIFGMIPIAGFMQPNLDRHTLVLSPYLDGSGLRRVAFHEYTHYLLRSRRRLNLPLWYEEGFARLLSTARVEAEGTVRVGNAPTHVLRRAVRSRRITLDTLIRLPHGLDWRRHDLPAIYEKSWALVHFLHLGEPPWQGSMDSLLRAIDRGASPPQAFKDAAGLDIPTLDQALRGYVNRRRLPVQRIPIGAPNLGYPDQRRLVPDDIAMLLGSIAARHNRRFARETLERLVASSDVRALIALSRTYSSSDPAALELTKEALARAPSDSDANVRMAEIEAAGCTSRGDDACDRDWKTASAYYVKALSGRGAARATLGLGLAHLQIGEPDRALGYLRAAYERVPWAPGINYYLGEAYRLVEDEPNARRHLSRALHWASDDRWRDRAERALALLPSGASSESR